MCVSGTSQSSFFDPGHRCLQKRSILETGEEEEEELVVSTELLFISIH